MSTSNKRCREDEDSPMYTSQDRYQIRKPRKHERAEMKRRVRIGWDDRPPLQTGQRPKRYGSSVSQPQALQKLLTALRSVSTSSKEANLEHEHVEEEERFRDPYGDVHPVFRDRTPPVENWFRCANEALKNEGRKDEDWNPSRGRDYERLNKLYKSFRECRRRDIGEDGRRDEGVCPRPLDGLESDWREMFHDEAKTMWIGTGGGTSENEGDTLPFCYEDVAYITNCPSETFSDVWGDSERLRVRNGFELERLRLRALLHVPPVWKSLESSLSRDAVNAAGQSANLKRKVSEIARAFVGMKQVEQWGVNDSGLREAKKNYEEVLRHKDMLDSTISGGKISVAGDRESGIVLDAQNKFLDRLLPHLSANTVAYLDSYTGGYIRNKTVSSSSAGSKIADINTCEKIMDMAREWPGKCRDEKPFLKMQINRSVRRVWRYKLAMLATEKLPEVDFSETEKASGQESPKPFCRQWNFGTPCYSEQLALAKSSADTGRPVDHHHGTEPAQTFSTPHPHCPGLHLCIQCSGTHRVIQCPDISNRCNLESLIENDLFDTKPPERRIDTLRIQPVELPPVDLLGPGRLLRRMQQGGNYLDFQHLGNEFCESDAIFMMPWGLYEDESANHTNLP